MDRVTPEGRWTAPPGQFAATIHVDELPGVFSKSLLVDFGTRAVLVEEGEILGELPPGTHSLDSLAERLSFSPRRRTSVVVVREEEVPVELVEVVAATRDGHPLRVDLRAAVQAADVTLFVENVLGARATLALDELRARVVPVLAEQLKQVVSRWTEEELAQAGGRDRLIAALQEAGQALHPYGLHLGPALTLTIHPQAPPPTAAATPAPASEPPVPRVTRSGRRTILPAAPVAHAARVRTDSSEVPSPTPTPLQPTLLINQLGARLALLSPGVFLMGSPPDEPQRGGNEGQHRVEIARPFYLGVFPVTQDEYRRVMGTDPSCFADPQTAEAAAATPGGLPVDRVSWDDACEFCRRLSELPAEQAAGRRYRLPTEAEWEYACRAGTTTAFACGPSLRPTQANFDGRSLPGEGPGAFLGSTAAVGSYAANAWGLYDMHGNLWEWCADWFSADYYRQSPTGDPQGPATGFARVLRGGSWRSRAEHCRSAARYSATPTYRHDAFGFRIACTCP